MDQVTYFAFDHDRERVQTPDGSLGFYDLLNALRATHEEDAQAGLHPDNYRFVGAGVLALRLGIKQPSLRKQICRLNKAAPALVENKPWEGYRLNPHRAWIVATDEIGGVW